jgi:hypothetical protein
MKIYYDTEFIEDGSTIELISIGMVAEDGASYYAVNADMPQERIHKHEWLLQNVWPKLPVRGLKSSLVSVGGGRNEIRVTEHGSLDTSSTLVRPCWVIRNEVRDFLAGYDGLELWAWYAAYDHVALAQLFGRMIDLPKGVPMWTNDLKQEAQRLGNPRVPEQGEGSHNALQDALHNRRIDEFLEEIRRGRA